MPLSPQVSLLNYVFLASWAFALPYSHYRPLASSVCTVWTCVIIICKMLYQLKSINPPSYSKNCSLVNMTAFLCIVLHCWDYRDIISEKVCLGYSCPQPESYSSEEVTEMKQSLLYKEPVEPAHWVGLMKSNDLLDYLRVSSRATRLPDFGGNASLPRDGYALQKKNWPSNPF